jgi:hypothetical protein
MREESGMHPNRSIRATLAGAALLWALAVLPRAAQATPRKDSVKESRTSEDPSEEEKLLEELERRTDRSAEDRAAKTPSPPAGPVARFFQSANPDISLILSVAGAYFNDRALASGNAVPLGEPDPKGSGMEFQELEMAIQAAVDPYFRLDTFLSFSLEGVEVEEAYFSTLALPGGIRVRAGLMNQTFGRHNLLHLHNWHFVDNMLPSVRLLGPDALRGVSLETSWLMPLPWYAELSMSVSSPTGANALSFVGEGPRRESFHIGDPGDLLYVFHLGQHLGLSDDWGLLFGLSYALGPNGSGGQSSNRTHLLGGDLYLRWRPLAHPYTAINFTTEWYGRLLEAPEGKLFDWGLYAMVTFRLGRRWFLSFRYDLVEVEDAGRLVAHGFVEPSTDLARPIPIDDQNRGSVSLTWRPTEFSQIRVQYNNNWIRRTTDVGAPGGYGQVHEVFLQLQGNIGAHGAHPY